MTAVVLVGELPSTGIIPEPVAWRVADSAVPEATLAFVQQTAGALRQDGAVLVIYPAWRPQAAVRLVRQARAYLATDRIAAVPLDLPPLALSLVADQLAFMAPHVRPGLLASLAQVLADRLFAGAWVGSVAKLEHVRTSLGQHMVSLMPGSGFMVAAGNRPGVHRVTSGKPTLEIGHRPLDPVLMLAAHEHGDVDWLQNKLKPELRVVSLTFVAGQPLGPRFWGTKKYAEFVAFSGHPRDLHLALQSVDCEPCPWCGEPTALGICPFCARVQYRPVAGHHQQARPPAGTGAGTARPGTPAPPPPAAPSVTPPAAPAPAPAPSVAQQPQPPPPMAQAPPPPPPPASSGQARAPEPVPLAAPVPDPPAQTPSPPRSFGGPTPAATAPQPDRPPEPGQRKAPAPGPDAAQPGGGSRHAVPARNSPAGGAGATSNGAVRPAAPPEPPRTPEPPAPSAQPSAGSDEATRTDTIEFRPLRNR
ncbi:hypothetical protein [Actinomadura sp. 21ATH]|uniref:hypothetical protein n=1 Tax=Actinomadura sp. 21ATH TaxID=1735444 RepID=UPI0035C02A94